MSISHVTGVGDDARETTAKFEVVDMDHHRIDKIRLVVTEDKPAAEGEDAKPAK